MNGFYVYVLMDLNSPGPFQHGFKFDYKPVYVGYGKDKDFVEKFKEYLNYGYDLKVAKLKKDLTEDIASELSSNLKVRLQEELFGDKPEKKKASKKKTAKGKE